MKYFLLSLTGIFVFCGNVFGQKLISGYSKNLTTLQDSILYGTAYYKTLEAKNKHENWNKKSYKTFSESYAIGATQNSYEYTEQEIMDDGLILGKVLKNSVSEPISEEQSKIIFQAIKDAGKDKTSIMNSAQAIEYFAEIKNAYDAKLNEFMFEQHTQSYPNFLQTKTDSLSYSLGYTIGENILDSKQAASLIIVDEFYPAFKIGLNGGFEEPGQLELMELQKAFQTNQNDPKVKHKITLLEGARMGNMYRELALGLDGFSLDSNLIELGLNDYTNYKLSYVDSASRVHFLIYTQQKMQELKQIQLQEKADANIAAGKDFMAQVAGEDGIIKTPKGNLIKVVKAGTGKRPDANDIVVVHYEGKRIDGTKFDSSYDRGETIEFGLQNVIKGWTEGLQFMQEGGTYIIYIPYDQAYGLNPRPGGEIEPGDTLVFKIELVEVKPVP